MFNPRRRLIPPVRRPQSSAGIGFRDQVSGIDPPPRGGAGRSRGTNILTGYVRTGGYSSGQRGQTVNLLAYAYGGSNPSPPTTPSILFSSGGAGRTAKRSVAGRPLCGLTAGEWGASLRFAPSPASPRECRSGSRGVLAGARTPPFDRSRASKSGSARAVLDRRWSFPTLPRSSRDLSGFCGDPDDESAGVAQW